jgi:phage head maturation protease
MQPLQLRADVVPSTLDADKRTVQVVWTTGARVMRGYFDQYWEELSLDPKHVRMDRLNSGSAPLLNAHNADDLSSVIGVVETASLQKSKGLATVRFARAEDDPVADQIFRKVADGIIKNVSVGYRVHKLEKIESSEGKIPVFRATDWEPHEISPVPVGADAAATVRSAGAATNPCEFTFEERAMDPDETDTSTADDLEDKVAKAATEAARKKRVDDARERGESEQQAAEDATARTLQRVADIQEIGERSGLGQAWATKLIKANVSTEKAREVAFAFMTKRDHDEFSTDGTLRVEAGDDARDKFVRGGTAWLIERSGHTNTIIEAKKVTRLAHNFNGLSTDPGEFRGMRMPDLARFALELRGRSAKGLHGEALIRAALQTRGDQGFNTTSDFAILLETAVNKIFVGQYALAPVTWPMWAGRKSVQDFRTSTFYRPGTFGVLDSVTEAGEIKHKNIPDGEKRTITPGTKANIIGITRRALANDDLGAFQNLASGLGLAAALTVESDAFAMVTANSGLGLSYDANPLFHSSRINIGPTGAMSPATLDGGRAVMAKQKDPSANQFLALRPAVWLGPVELGGNAKQFNSSTTDPTDNKAQGVGNKVLNLFRDIVDSPYLSAQSATRHYLLADPALYPVFAVGFIDGQEAPRIETEQSFGFDGVQMKVILDYGTAALDFRGAVTCAGV